MAVYGYCRVSTAKQASEGESLEVQRRQIDGYAHMHGLKLNDIVVEEGVSGSVPVAERPAGGPLFARLMKSDVVIAPKLDRLFRSALDALTVVEDLRKRGVALHLLDLGGDISGNGLSKLFLTIAAAFAEAERDRIRERITQVKKDQRERGRYLGGTVPFGFRRGADGELVQDKAGQEAIKQMTGLWAEGKALRVIADAVRSNGLQISHEGVAGALRSSGLQTGAEELEWRTRNATLRGEIDRALANASPKMRDKVDRIAEELPVYTGDTLSFLQLVHDNLLKRRRMLVEAAGVEFKAKAVVLGRRLS
jgi:DNA invertase Pin-like site-specific DNA recombinase